MGEKDESSSADPLDKVDNDYEFLLFLAGKELNSLQALQRLTELCATYLTDRHKITVIDVLTDFQKALDHKIFVVPTLILLSPPPQVTIVGNLNDMSKVLTVLRLIEKL